MTSFFDHHSDLRHGPIRLLSKGFSAKRGPCKPPPDVLLFDASSSVFPRDFVRTHSCGHTSEQSKNGITFRLFSHWFFDETRFCQPTMILNKFVYFVKGSRRNGLRTVPFSVSVDFVVFLTVFRRNVTSFFDHDSDLRHGPIRPLPNGFSTKRGPCNPPPDVSLFDASSFVFPRDFVRTHPCGHTSGQ